MYLSGPKNQLYCLFTTLPTSYNTLDIRYTDSHNLYNLYSGIFSICIPVHWHAFCNMLNMDVKYQILDKATKEVLEVLDATATIATMNRVQRELETRFNILTIIKVVRS